MNISELVNALEAILFASARPMSEGELKKVIARWMIEYVPAEATESQADVVCEKTDSENLQKEAVQAARADVVEAADDKLETPALTEAEQAPDEVQVSADAGEAESPDVPTMWDWRKNFKAAVAALKHRWQERGGYSGFALFEVAGGLTFRSRAEYASVLLAMREEKPHRLSRPAMETLAIVAYRQPVTKPECDHIRGVDCGGTIKMLLEKNLLRIVGKKEEPGRPLLYGTSPDFLSFFNLPTLNELPSLRNIADFDESEDDQAYGANQPTLEELSASAKQFRLDDEPEIETLEQAVNMLRQTEQVSRTALAQEGIVLQDADAEKAAAPAAKAESAHTPRKPQDVAEARQSP